jgi:antitoxin ParD1/3/4
MTVSLSPDLEELIRRQVASGRYGSADAVVREALGYLMAREERLGELRAALAVAEQQIARGDVVTWTPELHAEIFEQAREAARAGARPKADVCP